MVVSVIRLPRAGLQSAHRFLSVTSPISSTEYSVQAIELLSPFFARSLIFLNTVPVQFSSGGVPRYIVCGFLDADIAGKKDACCSDVSSCASSNTRQSPCKPRPPFLVRATNTTLPPFFNMICSLPSAALISFTYFLSPLLSNNPFNSIKVSVAVF